MITTDFVTLGSDGRIVIPAAARRELGLTPGQALVVESDGDSLLIRTSDAVLRETQGYFRGFAAAGGTAVDELIAARRDEAARDEAAERLARNPGE